MTDEIDRTCATCADGYDLCEDVGYCDSDLQAAFEDHTPTPAEVVGWLGQNACLLSKNCCEDWRPAYGERA